MAGGQNIITTVGNDHRQEDFAPPQPPNLVPLPLLSASLLFAGVAVQAITSLNSASAFFASSVLSASPGTACAFSPILLPSSSSHPPGSVLITPIFRPKASTPLTVFSCIRLKHIAITAIPKMM